MADEFIIATKGRGRKCAGKAEVGKEECGRCGQLEAKMEEMRVRMDEMSKVVVELKAEVKVLNEKVAKSGSDDSVKKSVEVEAEKAGMVWKMEWKKEKEEFKTNFRNILEEEKKNKEMETGSRKEGVKGSDGSITCSRREIRMEVAEEWERERRRNRLVLMGIPEVGEDGGGNEMVQEVMKGLMYGEKVDYQVLGRIGKKGLRARPIRVMVVQREQKRTILSRAKELKKIEGLQRVFVMPDLTREQQEEDFRIRKGRWSAGGVRGVVGGGLSGVTRVEGKTEEDKEVARGGTAEGGEEHEGEEAGINDAGEVSFL